MNKQTFVSMNEQLVPSEPLKNKTIAAMRACQPAGPKGKNKGAFALCTAAACLALAVLGATVVPGLLQGGPKPPIAGVPPLVSSQAVSTEEPSAGSTPSASQQSKQPAPAVPDEAVSSLVGKTHPSSAEAVVDGDRKLNAEDAVKLTQQQAYAHEAFGQVLPRTILSGFSLEGITLYRREPLSLFAVYTKGLSTLDIRVHKAAEEDLKRLTSPGQTERYDMSLYPIPLADSVPQELMAVVDCPVFRAEELTKEVLERRAYTLNDEGEGRATHMRFAVLCGDTVVEYTVNGADAAQVLQMVLSADYFE